MKKVLIAIIFGWSLIITTLVLTNHKTPSLISGVPLNQHIDNMPIIVDHPCAIFASNLDPVENRSEAIHKWLSPSIKIDVGQASGSGTIIYFNPDDNYAYIQSCGHLWTGNMTAEQGAIRKVNCSVITWFHNEKKLSASQKYPAEVIYYSNDRGKDVSLLRFKPDWVPDFFPIAPDSYPITPELQLHSVGCDGGREVAHYDVKVIGFRKIPFGTLEDIVTKENSPRPGRSGGGLMSDDGYYVGICWGTSDVRGHGIGLFTPCKTLREFNVRNGYGWLNDVGQSIARKIPILDRNNPQEEYPKNYIPLPGNR